MTLIDAQARLLRLKQIVFQTSDAANCLHVSLAHASKILGRLADAGFLVHLARAKWAISDQIDPLLVPEYLTAPFPTYISLQTALYYHGMISQIPSTIYAVSLARSRVYKTPLGVFSIHHLKSDFFFGYECTGKEGIKMATAEKALLDTLYLSPSRSLLFKALPELDISQKLKKKEVQQIIGRIKSRRLCTIVSRKFQEITHANKKN